MKISEDHMNATTRNLCYLKSFLGKVCMFSKNNHMNIDGDTDTNRTGNVSNKKIYFEQKEKIWLHEVARNKNKK